MSNLYEKQALENYLNDGITHGKKISYGSLGRNKNEIPQHPINYERQPIVMSSKPNSIRNSNKTNILQQPDNYDTVNYDKQPIMMNSKLNSTKNENNSKISVTELADKTKNIILKQKYELLQKLTKEEQMYENSMQNSNETNILQQPVNYERPPIIMNSIKNNNSNTTNILQRPVDYKKQSIVINSTKNENNSKISVTELSDKTKSIILKQKYELLQKLAKEEQMYENLLNSIN